MLVSSDQSTLVPESRNAHWFAIALSILYFVAVV